MSSLWVCRSTNSVQIILVNPSAQFCRGHHLGYLCMVYVHIFYLTKKGCFTGYILEKQHITTKQNLINKKKIIVYTCGCSIVGFYYLLLTPRSHWPLISVLVNISGGNYVVFTIFLKKTGGFANDLKNLNHLMIFVE